MGNTLQLVFPNLRIVGNEDKLEYLGCFDVYINGVGPLLDNDGRYYLFRKKNENRFPTTEEIADKLVALSMLYGSSTNIAQAQNQYKLAFNESTYQRQRNQDKHEYPACLTDGGEKEKKSKFEEGPVWLLINHYNKLL